MAMCFAGAWLLLDRALTRDALLAALFLAAAGTISAGLAFGVGAKLRHLAWTARFSAAWVLLSAGTLGFTAVFMMVHTVLGHHDLSEVPVRMVFAIMVISTAAALHNFLTLAGLAILPFALPVIVAFAALVARDSR